MTLTEKQQHLAGRFAFIDDPQERLSMVIDQAKNRPGLSAADRSEAHRVQGCVSVVWLVGETRDGRCYYRADAESPLVRGLLTVLCEFFSGATPAEIAASDADPLAALELTHNLSPTRRHGLASARATIQAFAQRQLSNPDSAP